jgi:hypothetical protein
VAAGLRPFHQARTFTREFAGRRCTAVSHNYEGIGQDLLGGQKEKPYVVQAVRTLIFVHHTLPVISDTNEDPCGREEEGAKDTQSPKKTDSHTDHITRAVSMESLEASGATSGTVRRPHCRSLSRLAKSCACRVVNITRALRTIALMAVESRLSLWATSHCKNSSTQAICNRTYRVYTLFQFQMSCSQRHCKSF